METFKKSYFSKNKLDIFSINVLRNPPTNKPFLIGEPAFFLKK